MVNTGLQVKLMPSAPREAVKVSLAREIDDADLEILRPASQAGSGLKRLRDTHHGLARLIAVGISNVEASSITGYTPSYISTLKNDPAFQELVQFYRSNLTVVQGDLHQRMTGLSLAFVEELRDRLETAPESMTNDFVLDALKVLADRTGHAPVSKNINVNVDLAGRLEAARRRADAAALPAPSTSAEEVMDSAEVAFSEGEKA